MNTGTLGDIFPGESCVIETLNIHGAARRRLMDMGFLPGTKVQCAFRAPSGSPMAFWVKEALIALRRCDCRQVGVIPDA